MIRFGISQIKNSRGTQWASNGRSRTSLLPVGRQANDHLGRPFDYPDHSYIPYSMERDCMKTHYVAKDAREDRLFILAKSTEYFNEPFTGIPRDFWTTLSDRTNLTAYSTAEDDESLVKEGGHTFGVPDGIESLGRITKAEFEVQMARAKVMLGLGRPYISPSVYSALYVSLSSTMLDADYRTGVKERPSLFPTLEASPCRRVGNYSTDSIHSTDLRLRLVRRMFTRTTIPT